MDESDDVMRLLPAARSGDRAAEESLFQIVYAILRQRAHVMLRGESHADAVSSGTVVHEVFLKLFRSGSSLEAKDRAHFYGIAGRAMRQVIVEHARKRRALKRGSGPAVSFDEMNPPDGVPPAPNLEQVMAIADLCEKLTESKPALGQVVELHFFCGFPQVEIAELLGVSSVTIGNRLKLAKAFLHREWTGAGTADAGRQ